MVFRSFHCMIGHKKAINYNTLRVNLSLRQKINTIGPITLLHYYTVNSFKRCVDRYCRYNYNYYYKPPSS